MPANGIQLQDWLIAGWLYDAETSQRQRVTLTCSIDGLVTFIGSQVDTGSEVDTGTEGGAAPVDQLIFSPRIGNTARFITLPNKSKFETTDNDTVDAILSHFPRNGFIDRWAYRFENAPLFIFATVLIVAVFAWTSVTVGIPWLSKQAAQALPVEVATDIGQGTLDLMDESFFSPTELSQARQDELRSAFESVLPKEHAGYPFQLAFRKGGVIGANAFALPSGTIVFTDEIIELANTDDELKSIMLHEIGHVVERHGLRGAIQQSGLAMIIVLVTGDISTASSLVIALPALLVESSYSQEMEMEADTYALENMRSLNLEPLHFANIMSRLGERDESGIDEDTIESGAGQKNEPRYEHRESDWLDYFSTHPATESRIERFRNGQ